MTNEAAQLSPRQRRPLSPLTTSHSDSPKGANSAVCYTSKYLLQMETALARLAGQWKVEKQPRGHLANTASFSGRPGNIWENRWEAWPHNLRQDLSEGSKFAKDLGFTLQQPLCARPLGEDGPQSFLKCVSGSEALRRIFEASGYQKGSAPNRRWLLFL